MNENMLQHVLALAERGWRVLPLHWPINGGCSCSRGLECPSPGKHPRTQNGVRDASRDPVQIEQWWRRWPGANVGVACGLVSRLIIVDVDPRNGGSLSAITARFGPTPHTAMSRTGGGGVHLLFEADGGKSCDPPGLEGVNILADGKLFVGPPSMHRSGHPYAWADGCSPDHISPAPAPLWLVQLCAERSLPHRSPAGAGRPLAANGDTVNERIRLATAAMLRCHVRLDERDGSKRLFAYACRAVEFDLSDANAIRAIRTTELMAPFPQPWTDHDIVQRLRAGGRVVRFGLPGQADLTGVLPGGLRLEIEVKGPQCPQTPEQKAFQRMIERFGGVYVLARSVQDVWSAIGSYLRNHG